MGRKGRGTARKEPARSQHKGSDGIAGDIEDPGSKAATAILSLLDSFQIEEAIAAVEEELKAAPDSWALAAAQQQAERMQAAFSADGVRAEIGLAPAGPGPERGSRGRGLFTTRPFRQGEILITEAPLLVASKVVVTAGAAQRAEDFNEKAVRMAYDQLDPVQRRCLDCFHAAMDSAPEGLRAFAKNDGGAAEHLVRFARIMKLNAHEYYPSPMLYSALYTLIARANHSCDPSCGLSSDADGNLLFYAIRDMDAGEEIDYSYLGGHFTLHPTPIRRKQLQESKMFECCCLRCQRPEEMHQLPCNADGCTEESDDSERLARYRRMEPLLSAKLAALEGKWHDPTKDVGKYIRDWEALAKSCGQALGARHPVSARACYFALQALNTGRSIPAGGAALPYVDDVRHASGMRLYGLPLIQYLKACCPRGARCVLLEPVAGALILLASDASQRELIANIVQEVGRKDLSLPLFDQTRNTALKKLLDSFDYDKEKDDDPVRECVSAEGLGQSN